jgi:hypothetical protein
MRRRRVLWLLAAVALLALAAALMWSEGPKGGEGRREVEFPSHQRDADWQRLERHRRELVLMSSARAREKASRDPVLVALSGAAARGSSMVFEVAALADTPVGRMVTDCLEKRADNPLAEAEREAGFDPAKDVDRIGAADDLVVVAGDFEGVGDSPLFAELERTQRGEAAVYTRGEDGGGIALWRDELMIVGESADALDEALALLAGEIPFDEEALPEADAYGEIHGSLDVDQAADLFGDQELAERFADAADEVKLHVDASGDVAIVADVSGGEPAAMADLGRALGGAMSLARLKARAEGEDELAALLDFAGVSNIGGGIRAEVALPLEFLESKLADCKWMGAGEPGPPPEPAAPSDGGA